MPNMIVLAYLGDSVYELEVRKRLLSMGKVNEIQKESLKYVSATSQRRHLEHLITKEVLSKEELDIVRRGRNTKGGRGKSSDIVTYRIATGLECLFGQLYLNNNYDRINELMDLILEDK
jgi:ribonuclease III family protein